jgi:hypothetical protein
MTAFPFLARPVIGEVLGLSYDEAFKKEFIEHTSKLFLYGTMQQKEVPG